MKKSFFYIFILMLVSLNSLFATEDGIIGRAEIGCGGSGCHSFGTETTLKLNNVPNTISINEKINLVFDVINASKEDAGLNLIIVDANGNNAGTISTSDSKMRIEAGELTHKDPKKISGGKASFAFSWTAPNTSGTFYVKASGNAINDGSAYNIMDEVQLNVVKPFYNINGVITENGVALSGVTVNAGSKSAITDANGAYSILDLPNGNYTVTPSKTNYEFQPQSSNVTINNADVKADFTALKTIYKVSGNVSINGIPFPDVSISYGFGTTTSDTQGNYQINNVSKGTNLTITPNKSNYSFSPEKISLIVNSDISSQDFTASLNTYKISGKVSLNGKGLESVELSIGNSKAPVFSNSNGDYEFVDVQAGNYEITPKLNSFSFSPEKINVSVVNSSVANQNFTAISEFGSISGKITFAGKPLANVNIEYYLNNELIGSVTSDTNGMYQILDLTAGTYKLIPSFEEYSFNPSEYEVLIAKGSQIKDKNFVASNQTYTISGIVKFNDDALSDVTITYKANKSTLTEQNGTFNFAKVPMGIYTVIPSKENYIFVPESITIKVEKDINDIKFEAFSSELGNIENMQPSNFAKGITSSNSLTWDKVSNASHYEIYFQDENLNFVLNEILDSNFYALTYITKAQKFSWKVRATNLISGVFGNWSETYFFNTFSAIVDKAECVFPEDKAIDVETKIEFDWRSVDNAMTYNLEISTNEDFSRIFKSIKDIESSYQELSLIENKQYYWRVQAVDEFGDLGEWSDIRTFTTAKLTSVESGNDFSAEISPNPASQELNILLNLAKDDLFNFQIYDIFGNLALNTEIFQFEKGKNVLSINIEELNSGVYFLLFQYLNNQIVKQVQVIH